MRSHWNLCTPGPRRKEQWPHRRLTQNCLWVSRSLQWRHGSAVASCRVGGTECTSVSMGTFEGGRHYIHYFHHCLKVKSFSRVRLIATPWIVAYQTSLSMGSSRPRDRTRVSCIGGRRFNLWATRETHSTIVWPQRNNRFTPQQPHPSTENWIKDLLSIGGGREEQPHVQGAVAARVQEGREELLHVQGQEGRQWGDTPHPR